MKHAGKIVFPVAGLLLLLAAGCQNTVNTVENADKSAAPTTITDKRFVTDGFLRDRLALRSVRMAPGASGNMVVEVAATNVRTGFFSELWSSLTGENPYPVDYKFTWQNADGITVETPLSAWRTVQVIPGETVYFKAVAPTPDCRDFILNVKESD